MENGLVKVDWIDNSDRRYLNIEIRGHLSETIAQDAVAIWKEQLTLNLKNGEKTNVVCNCLNMKGYDTEARKAWQQTVRELGNRIDCMWIITDNNLFRVAASTMGLMTKYKIKTAKSEAEVLV